jgi:hypothetical protein
MGGGTRWRRHIADLWPLRPTVGDIGMTRHGYWHGVVKRHVKLRRIIIEMLRVYAELPDELVGLMK